MDRFQDNFDFEEDLEFDYARPEDKDDYKEVDWDDKPSRKLEIY